MSNTDPTKTPVGNSGVREWHAGPASFKIPTVSNPVKVLAVIEERKHLHKKSDYCRTTKEKHVKMLIDYEHEPFL